MSFVDLQFWLFFPLLYGVYHYLPGPRSRMWLLLAGSLFFYGWWSWWYLTLIFFSAGLDFACGAALVRTERQGWRRFWLVSSLTGNLGLLFFFKYWGLFARTVTDLSGWTVPVFNLLLPIGISFYTFQTLSYTLDIYRRKRGAERSFADFLLYVSFFPQLVAGPIERSSTLLPQLQKLARPELRSFREGVLLIAWGIFLKLAVADNIRVFVNAAMLHDSPYPVVGLWLGAYGGWFMVYADFLAYTEIARGLGRMFGVILSPNFRQPFFSTTISGVWQRWHMTFTRWIFDYLAMPLYRVLPQRGARPLITVGVMAIIGLWHGATWNFVWFGIWNGVCMAVSGPLEALWMRWAMLRRRANLVRRLLLWGVMLPVAPPLFFITAPSRITSYLARMIGWSDPLLDVPDWHLLIPGVGAMCAWLGLAILLSADWHDSHSDRTWWEKLATVRASWLRWSIGVALLLLTALWAAPQHDAFVYFQF